MSQNGASIESILQSHQYEIVFRDPESILKKQLGDDITIVDFESEPLLKLGDNYGSTMMKISVSVKRKNEDNVEKLQLVGKLLPPTDYQRQLFESDYTFQKEIFFYEHLIPTYRDIYKEEFEIVPQYYGSRMALEPGTDKIIDEAAVLLLENLRVKGYYMEDRRKGLDLEHLEVIIPAIAKFHAIGLTMKHKKPSFLQLFKKYTKRLDLGKSQKKLISKLMSDIKNRTEVNEYYVRIKALYDNSTDADYYLNTSLELEEPWACVVHLDLWNNNMLFHRNGDGKIDDVKIVDFQTYAASSPLVDLIFLLCSSMQYPMEHFDTMIELYRETAYKVLEVLDFDACLFTKQKFEERLKIDAIVEIFHIIIMTTIVEYQDGDDFQNNPVNEFVIRRWKRVFEIFEQKKWF